MFSSLFRHRLLFVGVGILGIGYSVWVLQQDVRSPGFLRAEVTPTSWATISSMSNTAVFAVTYGNNKFVAVGQNGKGAYSTDGITWNIIGDTRDSMDFYSVTYGNNKFVAVGYGAQGSYSTDGITWTAIGNMHISTRANAVAFGNGKFVAGGFNGAGAYSTDGITWTAIDTMQLWEHIAGIAYGNGKFVAVDDNGRGSYSTDGVTWTAIVDMKAGHEFDGIVYGNGKFVAVDISGLGSYSTDGITWTAIGDIRAGIPYSMTGIAFGANTFVSLGTMGKGVYSTDGITWTAINDIQDGAVGNAIAYGNGKFVVGGGNSGESGRGSYADVLSASSSSSAPTTQNADISVIHIWQGADGGSTQILPGQTDVQYWVSAGNGGPATVANTVVTVTPAPGLIFDAAHSGTNCQLSGGVVRCTRTNVAASDWKNETVTFTLPNPLPSCGTTLQTTASISTTGTMDPDTSNNQKTSTLTVWCAGSSSSNSAPADSGIMTWNAVADMKFGSDPIYAITYGSDKFVAVGYNGKGAYSTDGANWTALSMAVGTTPLNSVTYGNGKFVSVGQSGKIAYSVNGISWTAMSSPISSHLYSVAYGNGRFVSVGAAGGMYSAEGIYWNRISDGHFNAPSTYKSVTYGNGKFVAMGNAAAAIYSSDGISWTSISDTRLGSTNITSVTYGGGRFVAAGYNGKGSYSDDGVTWTAIDDMRIISTEYNFYASAYGNNTFVAAGVNGSFSVGGVTWSPIDDMKLGFNAINAVAYGAGKFVAVSQSGQGSYSGAAGSASSSFGFSSSRASSLAEVTNEQADLSLIGSLWGQGIAGQENLFSIVATVKNKTDTARGVTVTFTTPQTIALRTDLLSNKTCKQKVRTSSSSPVNEYVCTINTIPPGGSENVQILIYPPVSGPPTAFTVTAEASSWWLSPSPKKQWRWTCGDGIVDAGEQCDGTNGTCSAQSCSWMCQCASVCGNATVETGEQCEIGRTILGSNVGSPVVADMNGDQKQDIIGSVYVSQTAGRFHVFLGNGNGTFQPPKESNFDSGFFLFRMGDFNGDSKIDAIILSHQDKFFFLPGNGDGTFGTSVAMFPDITIESVNEASPLQVADVNGDGATDLLIQPSVLEPSRLYLGGPGFATQIPRTFTLSFAPMLLADFDKDGKKDLAYAEISGANFNKVTVLYGQGNGTFMAPVSFDVSVPKSIKMGIFDINNDELPDIVFTTSAAGRTSYYAQSKPDHTWQITSGVINTYSPKNIADVNGDGFKDLLECSQATCGWMSVKLGRGDGTYGNALSMSIPYGDVADFNSDGKADFYGAATESAINSALGVYITPCSLNQLCSTCQCTAAVMTPVSSSSSSSSSVPVVALCGNGQTDSGETCDYAAADTCGGGQMCSGACSCITCSPTGTPVQFSTKIGFTQASIPDTVKLDGTHALVAYYDKSALMSMGMARVAEINGSAVTLGPAVQFTGEAPSGEAHGSPLIVFPVDATHAIIAFTTPATCKAVLATVSGNTVSFSSPAALFNRSSGCAIAFDGIALTRRYNSRVIERAVPTITGNQISWRFSEEDLFLNSTYEKVSIGAGKELRLSKVTYTTQRWPFLARLFAAGLGDYRIGICDASNPSSCECVSGSSSCKQFPTQFAGGKIIPVGGNLYQVFTQDRVISQWKVTPVTVNGNSLTIGTTVALSSFSFGPAFSSIPAVAAGRFYVDIRGDLYGMESLAGLLRMDVAPDGKVSLHESPAGAFLTPLSYIRVYKGTSYTGLVQVTNQCTAAACVAEGQTGATGGASTCCAGLTQLNQKNVNAQNACESQDGTFVCTRCGAAPPGDGQCGLGENRCNCAADCAGSSSSSSIMIDTISSSSSFSSSLSHTSSSSSIIVIDTISSSSRSSSSASPAVCGNFSLEDGEECEVGQCCANGYSCDTRTCACTLLSNVPTQNSTCGNYRVEAGEDCEDGLSMLQLPCTGTAVCDVATCRCPTGTARCSRWRSSP